MNDNSDQRTKHGKKVTFVRGIYIDNEIELMAKALAKFKKTSINQVFREAIVKLYYQEIGNKSPEDVLNEL